jgi:hypothetical protein
MDVVEARLREKVYEFCCGMWADADRLERHGRKAESTILRCCATDLNGLLNETNPYFDYEDARA